MSAEREQSGENKSVWHSRLFKGGLVAAVIGVATGVVVIAEVGVIAMGAGWAWQKK